MEKKLFVMRHAHSDLSSSSDSERTLSAAGQLQAKSIADLCQAKNLLPGIILCSTARRTRQTTEILLNTWKVQIPCYYLASLYNCAVYSILEEFYRFEENTALIVGHNPACSEVLSLLATSYHNLEPSQLAILVTTSSWSTAQGSYSLQEILSPKL